MAMHPHIVLTPIKANQRQFDWAPAMTSRSLVASWEKRVRGRGAVAADDNEHTHLTSHNECALAHLATTGEPLC
jgi:hypothetical protein